MTSPLYNEITCTAQALWNHHKQLADSPQLQLKGYIGHLHIPLLGRTLTFALIFSFLLPRLCDFPDVVFGFVVAARYGNLGFTFFVYLFYLFRVHFTNCQ
jgi:hypothetical protein